MFSEDECRDSPKVQLERDDGDRLGWVWEQGVNDGLAFGCAQASQMWVKSSSAALVL